MPRNHVGPQLIRSCLQSNGRLTNIAHVLGRRIKIITDHANLKWLTSISPKQSKLAHGCISMAEFDFEIKHRSGKDHVVSDTLSRAPIPEPSTVGDNLIIPPAPVDSFLIMALGLEIPSIDPLVEVKFSMMHFSVSPCLVLPQTQIGFLPEMANFSTTALRYIHIIT